ncbi:MAG: zinc-ribbon domain-containing protein [Gammaproteobacteria bacterium]|nr:zinc-ribbon domain-containing protein [Gammaproteobacteria bacterium]
MYTQCPRCETIFRVSAEILRAAAGQVRCGRCGAAFNALAHLEERPDDFPLAGSRLAQNRHAEQILESGAGEDHRPLHHEDAAADDDHDSPDEDFAADGPGEAGPGERIEQLRIVGPPFFPEDESLEFTVPPGDLDRVFIAPERGAPPAPRWSTTPEAADSQAASADGMAPADVAFEEIVIEASLEVSLEAPPPAGLDPSIENAPESDAAIESDAAMEPAATNAPVTTIDVSPFGHAEPALEAESALEAEPMLAAESPLASADTAGSASRPGPELDAGSEAMPGSAAAADAALLAAAARAAPPALPLDRPRHRIAVALWSTLAAFLVLLLAAQVVNREREFIASQTPFGEPLRALYARLGLQLPIPADLHDYQLRQWGVTDDPAANGILRVRASILNTAAAFQPYPWLRVTLTDRFGNRVGTRDFAPREYLGKPPRLMAPGQRANATLGIVDPGKNAEGFEIDLCLRGDSGEMLCDTGGS